MQSLWCCAKYNATLNEIVAASVFFYYFCCCYFSHLNAYQNTSASNCPMTMTIDVYHFQQYSKNILSCITGTFGTHTSFIHTNANAVLKLLREVRKFNLIRLVNSILYLIISWWAKTGKGIWEKTTFQNGSLYVHVFTLHTHMWSCFDNYNLCSGVNVHTDDNEWLAIQ